MDEKDLSNLSKIFEPAVLQSGSAEHFNQVQQGIVEQVQQMDQAELRSVLSVAINDFINKDDSSATVAEFLLHISMASKYIAELSELKAFIDTQFQQAIHTSYEDTVHPLIEQYLRVPDSERDEWVGEVWRILTTVILSDLERPTPKRSKQEILAILQQRIISISEYYQKPE